MTQPSLFILFTLVASSSALTGGTCVFGIAPPNCYPDFWSLQMPSASSGLKKQCQGPCYSDSDCDMGSGSLGGATVQLRCFNFGSGELSKKTSLRVPSCQFGTNQFVSFAEQGYCVDPNAVKDVIGRRPFPLQLFSLGRDPLHQDSRDSGKGKSTGLWRFANRPRMGECYGDCDTDRDCVVGAECFDRSSGSTGNVPGCGSGGITGHDCASSSSRARHLGERDAHSPPPPSPSTGRLTFPSFLSSFLSSFPSLPSFHRAQTARIPAGSSRLPRAQRRSQRTRLQRASQRQNDRRKHRRKHQRAPHIHGTRPTLQRRRGRHRVQRREHRRQCLRPRPRQQ